MRMLAEELTQRIPGESGGEPELVPAQEPPRDEAARADAGGGDRDNALGDVLPATQIEHPSEFEPRGAEDGDSGGGEHLERRMRHVQDVHRRREEKCIERERGGRETDHKEGMKEGRRRVAEVLLHARPRRFRLRALTAHLLFLRFELAKRPQQFLPAFRGVLHHLRLNLLHHGLGVDLVRAEIEGTGFEAIRFPG